MVGEGLPVSFRDERGRERAKRDRRGMPGGAAARQTATATPSFTSSQIIPIMVLTASRRNFLAHSPVMSYNRGLPRNGISFERYRFHGKHLDN